MIKHYTFNYNIYDAEATFKVDTQVFTPDVARATLEFFSWSYDKEADPVDEALKKYAWEAIRECTSKNCSIYGVKESFEDKEGFARIDGTLGIELMTITRYEFDEDLLDMVVVTE